ncbi:unnamed protein product, partial [Haemonchus placei]
MMVLQFRLLLLLTKYSCFVDIGAGTSKILFSYYLINCIVIIVGNIKSLPG